MKAAGKKFPLQKERCVEHANTLEIEIPWDIGITRYILVLHGLTV